MACGLNAQKCARGWRGLRRARRLQRERYLRSNLRWYIQLAQCVQAISLFTPVPLHFLFLLLLLSPASSHLRMITSTNIDELPIIAFDLLQVCSRPGHSCFVSLETFVWEADVMRLKSSHLILNIQEILQPRTELVTCTCLRLRFANCLYVRVLLSRS